MTTADRIRALVSREPTFYTRLWTTSINLVGVVVVAAVLFDVGILLGTGQSGIFRRALYPLGPPALTLGVGLAEMDRRYVALSGGLLVGYVVLLALVGTLGDALANGPAYVIGGVVAASALIGLGWVLGRRQLRVGTGES